MPAAKGSRSRDKHISTNTAPAFWFLSESASPSLHLDTGSALPRATGRMGRAYRYQAIGIPQRIYRYSAHLRLQNGLRAICLRRQAEFPSTERGRSFLSRDLRWFYRRFAELRISVPVELACRRGSPSVTLATACCNAVRGGLRSGARAEKSHTATLCRQSGLSERQNAKLRSTHDSACDQSV